jgi:hypothetical protein
VSATDPQRGFDSEGVIFVATAGKENHPGDTEHLMEYWAEGAGAAKIRWGEPHDFDRCVVKLAKYVEPGEVKGLCANLHHRALGVWPGQEDGGRNGN